MNGIASLSLSSPIGTLTLIADEYALIEVRFGKNNKDTGMNSNAVLEETKQQLDQYFAGQLKVFDLPLQPTGTEFQKAVWQQLLNIKYSETATYSDIAININRPKAVRAVGAANGKNPIPIIIPCHRIIGSNGTLTGYAGGLGIKEKLLMLENKQQVLM